MTKLFSAGSDDGTLNCLNITIVDDVFIEGNEDFTVTLVLETPGMGVATETTTTTVTIADNEGKSLCNLY